jgi:hypothetical protein
MIELLKPDGKLKARGKLLADLHERRVEADRNAWMATEEELWIASGSDLTFDEWVSEIPEDGRSYNTIETTEVNLVAYLKTRYAECRRAEYPPESDYLDAVVKGDEVAKQAYIDKCLAVKAKYPK